MQKWWKHAGKKWFRFASTCATSPNTLFIFMKFIYEDNSLKSGIYKITNTQTGRVYIGQAKEFKERWKGHRSSLLGNKNKNKFMQNDFNKCLKLVGHDDFLEFSVIEVLNESTQEIRNSREEAHIKDHKLRGIELYNFVETIVQPAGYWLGKTRSEEDKRKMSLAKKGKHLSPATEFKPGPRPNKRGANNPLFGKAPWNKGKTFMAGMKHPKAKVVSGFRLISPNGTIYTSIACVSVFAKEHGLNENLLRWVLNGKRKSHKGWKLD